MVGNYKVFGHEKVQSIRARGILKAVETLAEHFPLHDRKLAWDTVMQIGSVTNGGKTYFVEKER